MQAHVSAAMPDKIGMSACIYMGRMSSRKGHTVNVYAVPICLPALIEHNDGKHGNNNKAPTIRVLDIDELVKKDRILLQFHQGSRDGERCSMHENEQ